MAEIKHIQVDVKDPETGYLELTAVVAEVTKVTPKQGYALVGLRDFTGQEIQALIRGRQVPTQNDIGKVAVFALSGQTKGNHTNYSGFYNTKDEVPVQYKGKRPPAPASGATGSTGGGKQAGNIGRKSGGNRGFALSYAKDMVCAGAITVKQLQITAVLFNTYLDTGVWPLVKQPQQTTHQPDPPEQEIPETTGSFGTAGVGYDETGQDYKPAEESGAGPIKEPIQETQFSAGAFDECPF